MTLGSDEAPNPADRLNEALVAFTGCIGESFPDICSYSLTIGDSYVPFRPDPDDDCDEDAEACTQVWVRVDDVSVTGTTEGFGGTCAGLFSLSLEVGVLRCFGIEEGGEAPTASDVLQAAMQAMEDMNTIYCAAMSCEVWESITAGQWQPEGPLGGQYGGTWAFTVEL